MLLLDVMLPGISGFELCQQLRARALHMPIVLLTARTHEQLSREQLRRDVWGYSHLSVTRTVDNYVAKLRTHIEARPHEPRYLVTVHGSGYQLVT